MVLNPGHNGQDASHPEIINRLVPYNFHGGLKPCETTGTETNGGYPEHAFNFDVALRVRAILQAHGVRVALTRPNDDGVGPCVDERARIGNQPGSVAVVSIHADGAPSGDHGFHVCYASDPPAGAAVDAASRRLSTLIHDSLASTRDWCRPAISAMATATSRARISAGWSWPRCPRRSWKWATCEMPATRLCRPPRPAASASPPPSQPGSWPSSAADPALVDAALGLLDRPGSQLLLQQLQRLGLRVGRAPG